MALDAALLDAPAGAEPVLRFYGWSHPALSIGYFQSVEKTVQAFDCEKQRLWVVRRPTGGGLVRHGADLTLSICVREDHPRFAGGVSESYRAVHSVVREALLPMFSELTFSACAAPLKARSERLCFEEPVACDLEWRGAKVAGSSQRRKNGRLLHQMSIQLPGDAAEMSVQITASFEKLWDLRGRATRLTPAERFLTQQKHSAAAASAEWAFVPAAASDGKTPICS
jgi:lipoate-protein ligase A